MLDCANGGIRARRPVCRKLRHAATEDAHLNLLPQELELLRLWPLHHPCIDLLDALCPLPLPCVEQLHRPCVLLHFLVQCLLQPLLARPQLVLPVLLHRLPPLLARSFCIQPRHLDERLSQRRREPPVEEARPIHARSLCRRSLWRWAGRDRHWPVKVLLSYRLTVRDGIRDD